MWPARIHTPMAGTAPKHIAAMRYEISRGRKTHNSVYMVREGGLKGMGLQVKIEGKEAEEKVWPV